MIVANARSKENPLLKHLPAAGVLTSSELIGKLKSGGMTDENARQVIRRNSNGHGVWRSQKLRLPKDERLYAKRGFVGTPAFFRSVGAKLLETNRWGLARCFEALGERQALHKVDVMRLLAVSQNSTGRDDRRARAYQDELAGLEEVGVLVAQRNTPLECIIAPFRYDTTPLDELAIRAAAAVRKESLLARILVERLRRQNMFSWNRVELPDPERPYTTFNQQVFSSYAFSYLSPLVRWKEGQTQPTPCPVLIDSYQGLCLLSHVDSFLQRIERATHRGKSRLRSLGIIAAKDFAREAWTKARRNGLMTVSFRQMFGDEALEAMVLVEELLHDIAKTPGTSGAVSEFQAFSQLLEDLKTNPVVVTLRSIGFEALSGLALRSLGYEQVEMGRIAPWQNTTRDVDAFGLRGDELRVVECKAYHKNKSVPEDEVKKFFTETLPALKKWLRDQGKMFSKCRAEIWTTGPLGREARDALYKLTKPNGDEWGMFRGQEIQNLLPTSIKQRGIQLLSAIAMEETETAEDSWAP